MARGRLAFERAGVATAVRDAYAESPLRFLTPRSGGAFAWVWSSTLGGGLVDGDRVDLSVEVGPQARALLTTQGPTRVFRSPGGCSASLRARIGEGAALVLAPAPSACFGGARFDQRTEVDLARGASLALWDVLSAGRERWGFARYRSALAVRSEGRPLIDEACLLDAAQGPLPERLGRFDAIATLLLAGPLFASARAAIRSRLESPLQRKASLLEAASDLGAEAMVVRLAAASVEVMLRALRAQLFEVVGGDPWRSDASFAA